MPETSQNATSLCPRPFRFQAVFALSDCTLIGNSAQSLGDGAYLSQLTNCSLIANSSGSAGGGAEAYTLVAAPFPFNSAGFIGGGAWDGSGLLSCAVTCNSSTHGSGLDDSGVELVSTKALSQSVYAAVAGLQEAAVGQTGPAALLVFTAHKEWQLVALEICTLPKTMRHFGFSHG